MEPVERILIEVGPGTCIGDLSQTSIDNMEVGTCATGLLDIAV